MLTITILDNEIFNDLTNEFEFHEGGVLKLEHSLASISKWEAKWCKPFLKDEEKTLEEKIDYFRCMIVEASNPSLLDLVYADLLTSPNNIELITSYINSPMTATTFNNSSKKHGRDIITSEIIYYWMIALQIPFECQYWHLNRLLTLINVCSIKNTPNKKMGKGEILARNRLLNEERKKKLNTKG